MYRFAFLITLLLSQMIVGATVADVDFAKEVAPVFEQHCLSCHSDNISKGDVSLSTIGSLVENDFLGEGDPSSSHLLDLISGDDPEMPQQGEPLSDDEVAILRAWIAAGANWPDDLVLREPSKADTTWWSLQPLAEPAEHEVSKSIDAWINQKLTDNHLSMNPPADRRTLIRRATYDLTGLPPTPKQVEAFVLNQDAAAYENLIDRLLESPSYGERWGRHWLDVVRFGESIGFERNIIINDLWPFRDYIIRSLNEDKPMDQLIREHIAGDVIAPGDPQVETGSAFLVAGPYDNVGNQDAVQIAQIRANTIDEMVRATSEAFLGLTVGCARCHDHKFDPILQSDYYQLYATFAGIRHGSRVVATDEERKSHQTIVDPLQQHMGELTKQRDALNATIAKRAAQQAENHQWAWTREPLDRRGTEERFECHPVRFVRLTCEGLDTNPKAAAGFRIDELEIWSCGPKISNVALASNGGKASGPSRVIEDFPGAYGPQLAIDGKMGARFISTSPRLTIELPQPTLIDRVLFSSARGEPKPQHAKFAFVSDYRIETSLDGETWAEVANGQDRKPVGDAHRKHRLFQLEVTSEEREQIDLLSRDINRLTQKIKEVPALRTVWVGNRVAADAKGPFHIFLGGSPQRPGKQVLAASLSTLGAVTPAYELPVDSEEADRRMSLADWIVHPANPLTPRVLANRIWHYHFGTGLVSTPSDLGYMGDRPSHPELLDWLASRLIEEGWRLKAMHKRIMMSRVYQQSSEFDETAARVDRNARLLWRFPPRRLSAEEIRDTMLLISGRLDSKMGGPGFRLYRYLQDNVATYVPRDQHGPETYRRSVYHQNARASRIDLMTDFDQPDCAFGTARRAETTTPLQALTLLNHTFTRDMSVAMAARVVDQSGDDITAQVRQAFALCYCRAPSSTGVSIGDDEFAQCIELTQAHGLPALCRVLLNTSELIYLK